MKGRIQGSSKKTYGARFVIIVVSVLMLLFWGILSFSIAFPYIKANSTLRETVSTLEASDGTVLLCDPYVITQILPEVKECTPSRETGKILISLLLSAMKHAEFEGSTTSIGGSADPYICVEGDKTVYIYLNMDTFQIEKNSTFYSFSPKSEAEKEAYAEFYDMATALISGEETP